MEDSYKHQGMRRQLIATLKQKGIKDEKVLEVMGRIPRHYFFENAFLSHAYEDKAFPIGSGQTISQPYTVAFMTQLLHTKPGDKVLEIGTGSGYQAAVLCALGVDIYSIEYVKALHLSAADLLGQMGYRPKLFWGDGSKGLAAEAPYKGIIVTAGAPAVPQLLLEQLEIGGRLVIPVGNSKSQEMHRYTRVSASKVEKEVFSNFSFVPLKGKHGWSE
ncbi:protein-L-isoaspartate(D-aspartate) O-methyltransferase [Persicobacter sp. CCB-QB2]|uniref:protein-L-isoaspartate(D-aspartate) O-methyltransferase n=1 Tax=Persicobacter sp. CCB-QB2 TaxID=1561025 RepID=UPI0006A98070|nr:protein-L-isoaspartate(D-aspartate) O-methyltransferase [Persicobacter sp. CCB-QB2]